MAAKRKVTLRAVERRCVTQLRKRGQDLRKLDGKTALVDSNKGKIVTKDVDVAALAESLGVLKTWEEIE